MATNQNRTIVHSRDYSSVRLEVYSTGAAYFRWIIDPERDFSRDLLRITNAAELLQSGYLNKIANLLQDEDSARHLTSQAGTSRVHRREKRSCFQVHP